MYIEDKDIHKGHRSRMRSKLKQHGPRIFDTYELLEMLLYYCIPYKDTNPIAKRLLAAFGSLDGVLSAPPEELALVDGIGIKCAEFINRVGNIFAEENRSYEAAGKIFDDYYVVGDYLVDHFRENESKICIMLFDNAMRLIKLKDIPGHKFGSAAVRPKYFIDAVLETDASIAILAHVNEHGPLFPTESDMATGRMLREELRAIGVVIAEQYVICGNKYIGVKKDVITLGMSATGGALKRFCDSIPGMKGGETHVRQ